LILATLDHDRDRRGLSEEYADKLPSCLRVHQRVSDDAVAIVMARLSDFPIVKDKLLPGCGFGGISRLFLAREPNSADVTDAEMVIVAARAQRAAVRFRDFQWLRDGGPLDAASLACRLVPEARNKIHLFARADTVGWEPILGEANWSQADE
jgi:hypothetical protein